MSRIAGVAAAAAALIMGTWAAEAAVTPSFRVDGLVASGMDAGSLGRGDGFAGNSTIINKTGSVYSHTYEFTLAETSTVEVGAAWFSIGPFANSLSWTLSGPGGTFGSPPPTFIPIGTSFPPGIIVSGAAFAGLAAGDYTLEVTGTIFGATANYDVKVGITPIPAAAMMLAPALIGLGYFGYRRRAGAA